MDEMPKSKIRSIERFGDADCINEERLAQLHWIRDEINKIYIEPFPVKEKTGNGIIKRGILEQIDQELKE